MASGDLYVVDFWQTVHGNPVLSSLAYEQTVNESVPANVNISIANGFAAAVGDAWAAVLSEDWAGSIIQVRRVLPGPINPYSIVLGGAESIVGAIASEALPSNAPLVVSKYTSVVSRRGRGRWYQSGIPESIQDCGQIVAASMAGLQIAANGLTVELAEIVGGAGRWSPCVISNTPGPVPTSAIIAEVVARPNLANMRPRRSPPSTV